MHLCCTAVFSECTNKSINHSYQSIETKTQELHQETMKVNRNAGAILREFERLEQIRTLRQQQQEGDSGAGIDGGGGGGASGMSVNGGGGSAAASVVTESAYQRSIH